MSDARTEPADSFIRPPWASDVVDALNRYQRLGYVHEFTCEQSHVGADRTLYATRDGWRCPHCDYRQDWAHAAMLDAPRLESRFTLPADVMVPPATLIPKGSGLDVLMDALKALARLPVEEARFNDPGLPRYQSPLRDLCMILGPVVQAHPAYPQASAAVGHLIDHLSALARCEEANRDEAKAVVYRR
jgi:hypothetical protein